MKLRSPLHIEPYLINKYWGGQGSQIKSGVRLPGTAGNYLSTPDSVLNSVTGDIDIRWYGKATNWTPVSAQELMAKWQVGTFSWQFILNTGTQIRFAYSQDGSSTTTSTDWSFGWTPPANGTAIWLRVTVDVDNGAGGHTATLYSSVDGITWTQIGTSTIAGVATIADSTSQLEIGSRLAGTGNLFDGTIYYAEVRNGIDGPVVVKFDSSQVAVSGAQLPATVNGWTWNGSALYKRDDYVRLPGTSGNYLSFPDTAANSVTGDIDIRFKLSMDNWTPAAAQDPGGKWQVGNRSWKLIVDTSGRLQMFASTTGSDATGAGPGGVLGFVNGSVNWIRATRVASTGVVQYFTSPDGVTWTQSGSNTTLLIGQALVDNTSPMEIGSVHAGTAELFAGNVYYAEVRNGINGPVVASFDARVAATPWTINGAAWNWEGSSFVGKPGIALSLPGTGGNYASTPDTSGNSIVGDLDIRVKAATANWAPSSRSALVAKWVAGTNNRSYALSLSSVAGKLNLLSSTAGTAGISTDSTAATSFVSGQTGWVRATLAVATGTLSFYQSIDGLAWTSVGTPVVIGATSIFDSTAALQVGERDNADPFTGTVYYAEVRNGIDGPIVAVFDPTNIIPTGVRLPTNTVQPGGSPNGLNPNQASIETDATGWVTGVGAPTLAQDATQFLDGTKSLSLVATAAGPAAIGAETTPVTTYPVVANKLYTARASFRTAVTGQLCKVGIHWYTAASASISTSFGSTITDLTSGWTEAVVTALAPATAAYATVQVEVAGALITEKHFIDRISEVESAEVWTLNGSAWNWVAT